jgi:hypothetical protein
MDSGWYLLGRCRWILWLAAGERFSARLVRARIFLLRLEIWENTLS